MDSLGYKISDLYNIDFLNAGYCSACDICTIHSGCKNPEKRVYCITGSGIMLGNALESLFEEKLQWFAGGVEPDEVIKIMGFLSREESSFLVEELNNIIKY